MSTKTKGDILETITEILEKSISGEGTVISKNKKIEDLDGVVREIDIYVETYVNKRKFNIAIECKNYDKKYRIDIDKIGGFYEKCSRLPFIHRMIFLTTSDYQKGAITKARTRNIELYKITQDEIANNNALELGASNVSVIEKECKILGIRFNSSALTEQEKKVVGKLNFFHENGSKIENSTFKEKLIGYPDIWKFLVTATGFLLNHKKIIHPNLSTENVYTKYNEKLYLVDSLQFTLEIEYVHRKLEFNTIKKYYSLNDDVTLATFSDVEFITNGITHRFHYIKPKDEDDARMFMSSDDCKDTEELKTLGSFEMSNNSEPFKPLTSNLMKNIQIEPYEFKLSKDALKNSINEDNVSPIEGNKKIFQNKGKNKSSIYIAIEKHRKKLFFMIPFTHNKKLITAKIPEPISLYVNHAFELFNKSQFYKDTLSSHANDDEKLLLQDDNFHKYLQYSISCIFMLHSAIELFVNSCIKEGFKFAIEGKELNKNEIEKELSLSEKLEFIVPSISEFKGTSNKKIYQSLSELIELNEELQNLKMGDSINSPFLDTFEILMKFNLKQCIASVQKFFSKVNKNFKFREL